jgi:hypothetical protein
VKPKASTYPEYKQKGKVRIEFWLALLQKKQNAQKVPRIIVNFSSKLVIWKFMR